MRPVAPASTPFPEPVVSGELTQAERDELARRWVTMYTGEWGLDWQRLRFARYLVRRGTISDGD